VYAPDASGRICFVMYDNYTLTLVTWEVHDASEEIIQDAMEQKNQHTLERKEHHTLEKREQHVPGKAVQHVPPQKQHQSYSADRSTHVVPSWFVFHSERLVSHTYRLGCVSPMNVPASYAWGRNNTLLYGIGKHQILQWTYHPRWRHWTGMTVVSPDSFRIQDPRWVGMSPHFPNTLFGVLPNHIPGFQTWQVPSIEPSNDPTTTLTPCAMRSVTNPPIPSPDTLFHLPQQHRLDHPIRTPILRIYLHPTLPLLIGLADPQTVVVYNLHTRYCERTYALPAGGPQLIYLRQLLMSPRTADIILCFDTTVLVCTTEGRIHTLSSTRAGFAPVAAVMHPLQPWLYIANMHGDISCWQYEQDICLSSYNVGSSHNIEQQITQLVISPCGRILGVVKSDMNQCLWLYTDLASAQYRNAERCLPHLPRVLLQSIVPFLGGGCRVD
jgi:hypothetical protein